MLKYYQPHKNFILAFAFTTSMDIFEVKPTKHESRVSFVDVSTDVIIIESCQQSKGKAKVTSSCEICARKLRQPRREHNDFIALVTTKKREEHITNIDQCWWEKTADLGQLTN